MNNIIKKLIERKCEVLFKMKEKLKNLLNEIFKESKKEFKNKIINIIAYTIPIFLLAQLYGWIFNPDMKLCNLNVNIISDKFTLSPTNSSPNVGKSFTIPTDGKKDLSEEDYFAPELEITLKGQGKIKEGYIIYKQDDKNSEDEWLFQKIDIKSRFIEHYGILPKKIKVVCNYKNGKNKLMYLMFVGNDNEQYAYCLEVDKGKEKVYVKKMEQIYEITPNEKGFWGMNKEDIQKNYSIIRKQL